MCTKICGSPPGEPPRYGEEPPPSYGEEPPPPYGEEPSPPHGEEPPLPYEGALGAAVKMEDVADMHGVVEWRRREEKSF
ncbi:hypothetical protein ACFX14_035911 [Malus domestica]